MERGRSSEAIKEADYNALTHICLSPVDGTVACSQKVGYGVVNFENTWHLT